VRTTQTNWRKKRTVPPASFDRLSAHGGTLEWTARGILGLSFRRNSSQLTGQDSSGKASSPTI
jgi:hypothetical protein